MNQVQMPVSTGRNLKWRAAEILLVLSLIVVPFLWGWLRSGWFQLLGILVLLLSVGTFGALLLDVFLRKDRFRRLCELVLFAVLLLLMVLTLRFINPLELGMKLQFKLAEEDFTSFVRSAHVDSAQDFDRLDVPAELQKRVYAAMGKKYSDGTVSIELWTGGAFPVIHSGFIYCSDASQEAIDDMNNRWWGVTAINEHWYLFVRDRVGRP